jgi:hypothetical protein
MKVFAYMNIKKKKTYISSIFLFQNVDALALLVRKNASITLESGSQKQEALHRETHLSEYFVNEVCFVSFRCHL